MNHMKTKKAFWHAAIAAIAICSFSACASSEEDENTKGSEAGSGEVVKAQFSISIPMAGSSTTRMTDAVVQKNLNGVSGFRGINDICLYPSEVEENSFVASSAIGSIIHLTQLLKPNNVVVDRTIPSGNLLSGSKSVLFGDVVMKLGTKTFLFYGKAIDETTGGDRVNGTLVTNVGESATTPSGYYFKPKTFLSEAPVSSDEQGRITDDAPGSKRAKILTYLNSIAKAKANNNTTWKPYNESNPKGTKSNTLKNLYNEFITMKAGSSKHLEAAINDLLAAVSEDQFPKEWTDYDVAQAILTAIKTNDYVTYDETAKTIAFNESIKDYPTDIFLPDGAAAIQWNTTDNMFYYLAASTQLNVENINNYAYPANLYYWCKSPILVSNTLQATNFTAEMTWDNGENGIFGKYTDGTEITSTTRSVILTKPVNYGVARLDISVAAGGTGSTSANLEDNGDNWKSSKGVKTKQVSSNDIKLTGVIIGGQKQVDWKFEPMASSPNYAIYDDIVASKGLKTSGLDITTAPSTTATNSTLVLESPGGNTEAPEKIPVVLEFVNKGDDFWGKDGIVAKDCKFYLVGYLDMSKVASTDDKTGGKVFKQDYYTIANFQINNLKQAVVTIPDLRNPGVELGLSVDLEWKQGNTFNEVFN